MKATFRDDLIQALEEAIGKVHLVTTVTGDIRSVHEAPREILPVCKDFIERAELARDMLLAGEVE